jgi:ribosomal protein L14E/L6E/L27E
MNNKNRYIELGRVVVVNYGSSVNKIGIIVDIIDKNRCIIDGPCGRQVINVKRLLAIKHKIQIKRGESSKNVHRILTGNIDKIDQIGGKNCHKLNANDFKKHNMKIKSFLNSKLYHINLNTGFLKKAYKNNTKAKASDFESFLLMIGNQFKKAKTDEKKFPIPDDYLDSVKETEINKYCSEIIKEDIKVDILKNNNKKFIHNILDKPEWKSGLAKIYQSNNYIKIKNY